MVEKYSAFTGNQMLSTVKSSFSWDITPNGPLKVNRLFGGTCPFHLQGRRISQARNQRESRWQVEQSACRNFGLSRKQEGNGGQQVSSHWLARRTEWTASAHWLLYIPKRTNRRREQHNQPHKLELFITTAVRNSKPMLNTVLTRPHHWGVSRASSVQSVPTHLIYLRISLILSWSTLTLTY
jgi:hypothetical protein